MCAGERNMDLAKYRIDAGFVRGADVAGGADSRIRSCVAVAGFLPLTEET